MADSVLLDVSHASKRGTSLRISIPRKVMEKLEVGPEDIIGFYVKGNEIVVKKVK